MVAGAPLEAAQDHPDAEGPPASLRGPGAALWRELKAAGDPGPGGAALILEACRLTDRCDGLDRLVNGSAEDWLSIVESKGDPDRQELVVDKLLAESRQQQLALTRVLGELRQRLAPAAGRPAGGASRAGSGQQMGAAGVSEELRNRVAQAWGTPTAG